MSSLRLFVTAIYLATLGLGAMALTMSLGFDDFGTTRIPTETFSFRCFIHHFTLIGTCNQPRAFSFRCFIPKFTLIGTRFPPRAIRISTISISTFNVSNISTFNVSNTITITNFGGNVSQYH
jgi:hypothetical protein